ncbi:MAG: ATP-dependent helicase HrpB [Myxococcales bacterium]|nr:ATP-dependent helicase HrpB [Polyangiaceae bacterium]MDW8248890.1 ATP-dependent helicase HrpB [Myxococcales bacterium]
MQPLPIDPLLPELIAALRKHPSLVLEAPPGAGKTTRVPRALLDSGLPGEILVLEPRRLAARLAARRVAEELQEPLGKQVGYRVRFEEVGSPETRIRFVTEGTLTRMLLTSPRLEGVGTVLLDEFHERHLQTDLAFALLARLQRSTRPDLRLVVMSATLDGARVADALGAPRIRSEGRYFHVRISYQDRPDDRPLELQIVSGVRQLIREGLDGHILVFVPGAREIRLALTALAPLAQQEALSLHALHGELSHEEQDAALQPNSLRKIIVATNVAESSITIEGVTAVIDSGLARVASYSPWTGLPTLRTERISRASAAQRAGRAGRTREGRCIRLYTLRDHDTRAEHDPPELLRADLSECLLELAHHGLSPAEIPWLDPPPEPAIASAVELLQRLGALDDRRTITPTGRSMLRFPLHPRLARLVVEAERAGVGRDGCRLAALLAERDIRQQERASFTRGGRDSRLDEATSSDPLARLDELRRAEQDHLSAIELRTRGLDPSTVGAATRAARQLLQKLSRHGDPRVDEEEALRKALLLSFPDRVARRRRPGGRDLILSGGGSAIQGEASSVLAAPFVVVVAIQESEGQGRGSPIARSVSAIEPEWLLELFPERIREERELSWNPDTEFVESVERLLYDRLVLDETRRKGDPDEHTAAVLAEAALKKGLAAFVDPPEILERWLRRARFLAGFLPDFPRFDEADLRARMEVLCVGKRSFEELRQADLLGQLASSLSPEHLQKLHSWAPEKIELPGGRRCQVHYDPDQPPYIESRLQDFFGMRATPTLAGGRVPLVLRMLAPNQRPVQITTDLAGFWERTYPSVRRELCRKYPRHSWPDDPLTAEPPAPRGQR